MERTRERLAKKQMPRKWRGKRGEEERLRWEDCVKRDMGRVEEDWETKATRRGKWRRLVEKVLLQK